MKSDISIELQKERTIELIRRYMKTLREAQDFSRMKVFRRFLLNVSEILEFIQGNACSNGKWRLYEDEDTNAWECSVCHEVWQLMEGTPEENNMHYCHNCGAKMTMEAET